MCPLNTFSSETGSTACSSCPNGESTRGTTGAVSCTRNALVCPPGTYLFDVVADTSCTGCPAQGIRCVDNAISVLSNFWFPRVTNAKNMIDERVSVFPCLNDVCCSTPLPVEAAQTEVTCNEGYGGVLCGACERERGWIRSGQVCSYLPLHF